jgi:two-component system, OmpR family, sensor histidine kinase KdpD
VLGNQPLGVAVAYGNSNAEIRGEERRRLLQAFAAQTALAVGRTRLAQEEERARAAAESERLKSVFLASVSHDLRTPLTVIRTAAAGLLRASSRRTDAAQRELAASIDQEAERLNRFVENLLEMSRIEAGSLPLHRKPEDLAEIVGTAAHRLAPLFADRTLRVDVPDDLPLVSLDAVQMDRVVANLLENAAKFSPPRSAIAVRVWLDGGCVHLWIHNEGPHLPQDQLSRIFDKFYRLDPGGMGIRGTGLGLAICKGIVEAHGGTIRAQNDSSGVSFIVSIPLTGREAAGSPSRPASGAIA